MMTMGLRCRLGKHDYVKRVDESNEPFGECTRCGDIDRDRYKTGKDLGNLGRLGGGGGVGPQVGL
jgi:hypothetical protein